MIEGYMLKKKRKALQGFGRRYFRLSSSGSSFPLSLSLSRLTRLEGRRTIVFLQPLLSTPRLDFRFACVYKCVEEAADVAY